MDVPLEMHIEKKEEKKEKLSNWLEVKKELSLNW